MPYTSDTGYTRCRMREYEYKFADPFTTLNPFTPKTDQFQISPAASPEILHHTVWRTSLFIAIHR